MVALKEKVGDDKVVLGLSGGVDSTGSSFIASSYW
jgi:GMP synthase PP-ATPase subunit